jgi:aspartyl-tRNA(Asn)/glutamyl-tRNA(Gln) amidotransferase subunit A
MYAKTRAKGFGEEVQRRIILGTFALSAGYFDAYYKKALAVRDQLRQEFAEAFQKVDFLLGPTAPGPAFRLDEKQHDPLQMYLCDIFTAPSALAGVPAISFPGGQTAAGLPLGLQAIGPRHGDGRLLEFVEQIEQHLGTAAAPVEVKP